MKTMFSLKVMFMLLLSYLSFVDHASRQNALNYWNLTRNCNVVISGTITNINEDITINVSTIYKGDNVPDTISFKIPAARTNTNSEEFIKINLKEKCIVFLNKEGIDKYNFIDAATGNIEFINLAEKIIQDVLILDSLESEIEKCKMLISLMSPYQNLRSYHAFNELNEKYNSKLSQF